MLSTGKSAMKGKNKGGIWSFIDVEGLTVIDFGVGESTKKLVNLGARVIAVDWNVENLIKYDDLGIPLIKCDIASLPFNARTADLAVFYFTLHEIDPLVHKEAVSNVYRVSSKIMVVEPSPKGCLTYQRYAELWRKAMHSIGRFEDYRPVSYWKKLIERCGFEITVLKRVRQDRDISHEVLEEEIRRIIDEWRKLSVGSKYVNEMDEFLEYAKRNGMRWSDLIVMIGESKESL